MTFDEYQELSRRTRRYEDEKSIFNATLGIAGEAGEVADVVKKSTFHGHPVDRAKVAEELGDLLWYASWLADLHSLTLAGIAEGNIAKLKRRYPEGFSEERSRNRGGNESWN